MDEDVQEKIVSKPRAFDSLSNITYQKDPVQYKQYIGYKLYCLPISNKYKRETSSYVDHIKEFRYKSPRKFVKPHKPFAQTNDARAFIPFPLQYKKQKEIYEKKFIVSTDIYNATTDDTTNTLNHYTYGIFTPYESIQNTYFTILNIEISYLSDSDYTTIEKWENPRNKKSILRFTLKNETTEEELYWIIENSDFAFRNTVLFLVPYFEKMQKTYKDQNVVSTKILENLADINTGEPVNIQPREVWRCYNVTFVNSKDHILVQPYFFLEKDGAKVMIRFEDFTEKCRGIFTEEDQLFLPTFILEQQYNDIIAEKQRTAEEKQRLEEERQRQEELARLEHNKLIMQKYGNKYGKLICDGKVCLNMTKEMCIEAWGEPLYVNSTIVSGMVHEQWVYGWHNYLYFDNGTLKAIQN
jgi:hypothetical protein